MFEVNRFEVRQILRLDFVIISAIMQSQRIAVVFSGIRLISLSGAPGQVMLSFIKLLSC